MKAGTILWHEGVGVVEEVGKGVRNLRMGASSFRRPNGPEATVFYGGPEMTGPFDGLQAEFARVPFANVWSRRAICDRRLSRDWRWRARKGAEIVDFEAEDPVETLKELTMGIGPERRPRCSFRSVKLWART